MNQRGYFIIFNITGACRYLCISRSVFDSNFRDHVHSFNINESGRQYFLKSEIDKQKNIVDKLKLRKITARQILEIKRKAPLTGLTKTRNKKLREAERQFANYLESQGKTWEYEPIALDMGIPCKKAMRNKAFIPDFWCLEDNCYYEVSATRQAKEQSQKKITLVLKANPTLKIIIVHPDGREYGKIYYDKSKLISTKELSKKFSLHVNTINTLLRDAKLGYVYPDHCKNMRLYDRVKAVNIIKNHNDILKSKKLPFIDGEGIRKLRMKYKITMPSLANFLGVKFYEINWCEKRQVTSNDKLLTFFSDFSEAEKIIKNNINKLRYKPTIYYPTFESLYNRKTRRLKIGADDKYLRRNHASQEIYAPGDD